MVQQNPRPYPQRPTTEPRGGGAPVPPRRSGVEPPRRPPVPGSGAPRRSRPAAASGVRGSQGVGSQGVGPRRTGSQGVGPARSGSGGSAATRVGGTQGPTTTAEHPPAKKIDLTVNKVLAGAGAAATSAVFGSFFGATGTVVGAALGSVVTTVGTTIYQRSLDRTRDTVLQRIKIPGQGETVVAVPVDAVTSVDPLATVPMQRGRDDAGHVMLEPALEPVPATSRRRPRKRVIVAIASTVVAFLAAMLVITGVEWIKGSPISGGDSGTSVSRAVTGGSGAPTEQEPSGSTDTTESTAPTTSETPAPQQGGGTATQTPDPSSTTTTTPRSGGTQGGSGATPTTAPNGATDQGGQNPPQ